MGLMGILQLLFGRCFLLTFLITVIWSGLLSLLPPATFNTGDFGQVFLDLILDGYNTDLSNP